MSSRTPRNPPGPHDLALFTDHLARTEGFSNRLVDGRCQHTDHFVGGLLDTLGVLRPLMSAWNTEILFVLMFRGSARFNRILEVLAPISARVLTDKLRHLEAHGYLARWTDTHTVYALTETGARIAKLLHPLLYYLHNHKAVDGIADTPTVDATDDKPTPLSCHTNGAVTGPSAGTRTSARTTSRPLRTP